MLKCHRTTPAHLLLDDTPYFVTGAIYQKRLLLTSPELKLMLIEKSKERFRAYEWQLHHWVVLDNHYHLLGVSRKGKDLPKLFRTIHNQTASPIRETTNCEKPVWWNYWDYCPRNEKEYYVRLNYLLYNPVKHRYVTDLHNYLFSSFQNMLEEFGRDKLVQQFHKYPEYKTLVLHEAKKDDF